MVNKPNPKVKKTFKKKLRNAIKSANSTPVGVMNNWSMKMPFKPNFSCVMRYSQTFTLSTGTAGVMGTEQVMRLNCIFDPDYTGSGHQPYGYDSITPLYKGYRVNAVKATLIWSTIGGTSDVMCAYSFYGNQGGLTLTGTTCDQCTERPAVSTTYLSPSGNTRTVEQNIYIPLNKVFGVSKKEYNSDDAYGSENVASSAEPTKQAFLAISVGSPSGVASQNATVQIILYYYTTWHNVQILAQS